MLIVRLSVCLIIVYSTVVWAGDSETDIPSYNKQYIKHYEVTDDHIILYSTVVIGNPLFVDSDRYMMIALSKNNFDIFVKSMVDDIPDCIDASGNYWYREGLKSIDLKLSLAASEPAKYYRLYTEDRNAILLKSGTRHSFLLTDHFLIIHFMDDVVGVDKASLGYPSLVNGIPALRVVELPEIPECGMPLLLSGMNTQGVIYVNNMRTRSDDGNTRYQLFGFDAAEHTLMPFPPLVNVRPLLVDDKRIYCKKFDGPSDTDGSTLQIRSVDNIQNVVFELDFQEQVADSFDYGVIPISQDEVIVECEKGIYVLNTSTREVKQIYNFEEEYYKLHAGE